jgi:hypothetical protein
MATLKVVVVPEGHHAEAETKATPDAGTVRTEQPESS